MPYTAMHILQGRSGLSEDRFVNTFHFQETGTLLEPEEEAGIIAAQLEDFYTLPVAGVGGTEPLTTYLADAFESTAQIRVYALTDPEPREPWIFEYELTGITPAEPLPYEVALCASFYSVRNLPRQRGRIFIGPLSSITSVHSTGEPPRPSAAFRDVVRLACKRLADADGGVDWSTLSNEANYVNPPPNPVTVLSAVTAGWVDDAWDTQRRRGLAATVRDSWTSTA